MRPRPCRGRFRLRRGRTAKVEVGWKDCGTRIETRVRRPPIRMDSDANPRGNDFSRSEARPDPASEGTDPRWPPPLSQGLGRHIECVTSAELPGLDALDESTPSLLAQEEERTVRVLAVT